MSQPSDTAVQPALSSAEYSPEERAELLLLAHRAINATLEGCQLSLVSPSRHLSELRGAFTTLHLRGALRGCVGYVLPVYPLYQTIAETAVAAAFRDDRFRPVTPMEAPDLQIEISVLSPLFPITPDQIVLGVHGLVVSFGLRKGLLLPQVPIEWNWDIETYLGQTCRKAGLPLEAWRQGATLEAFTAEIFGESEAHAHAAGG